MTTRREQEIHEIVDGLIKQFDVLIDAFNRRPPFNKEGQLEYHQATIKRRLQLGSVSAALRDQAFLSNLYETLKAWGIGKRGSKLLEFPDFVSELQNKEKEIVKLEELQIDDKDLGIQSTSERLWRLFDSLSIVENKAKLVAGSKTLHHLLPDLVSPMDRVYTRFFFGWDETQYQNSQSSCFTTIFKYYSRIAKAVDLGQYVGEGWHTSRSKVIDNAVIGFKVHALLQARAHVDVANH